jgi:oligopeptide/dipeptide ABC transporter ATP-binding protein
LDVTVQAQILELLKELRKELGMAIVFITHDMGVVANLCDRVNVMYGGGLMETATIDQIFNSPAHPYTQALLNSIPSIDEEVEKLLTIAGEPPNLLQLPDGCPFQNRCSSFTQNCINNVSLRRISSRHVSKCTLPIGEPI